MRLRHLSKPKNFSPGFLHHIMKHEGQFGKKLCKSIFPLSYIKEFIVYVLVYTLIKWLRNPTWLWQSFFGVGRGLILSPSSSPGEEATTDLLLTKPGQIIVIEAHVHSTALLGLSYSFSRWIVWQNTCIIQSRGNGK